MLWLGGLYESRRMEELISLNLLQILYSIKSLELKGEKVLLGDTIDLQGHSGMYFFYINQ